MAKKERTAWLLVILFIIFLLCIDNNLFQREIKSNFEPSVFLYCNKDSDCIIPPKCTDATAQCKFSQCEYESEECIPQQIMNYILTLKSTIINDPDETTLNSGKYSVRLTPNKVIAGKLFSVSIPAPLKELSKCQVGRGEYLSPAIEGCYQVSVKWDDYDFTIKNGETIKLDDFVEVTYLMSGKGVYNGEKKGIDYDYEYIKHTTTYYSSNIELTLSNLLESEIVQTAKAVVLNNNPGIELSVTNNLFTTASSGYSMKVDKLLRDIYLPTEKKPVKFIKGTTDYPLDLPSDELGKTAVTITPYIHLFDNHYYFNEQLEIEYYVMQEDELINILVEDNQGINLDSTSTEGQIDVEIDKTDNTLAILIIVGLSLMLLLLIIIKGKGGTSDGIRY